MFVYIGIVGAKFLRCSHRPFLSQSCRAIVSADAMIHSIEESAKFTMRIDRKRQISRACHNQISSHADS